MAARPRQQVGPIIGGGSAPNLSHSTSLIRGSFTCSRKALKKSNEICFKEKSRLDRQLHGCAWWRCSCGWGDLRYEVIAEPRNTKQSDQSECT